MTKSNVYSFNTGAKITEAANPAEDNQITEFAHLLYEGCREQAFEDAYTLKKRNLGVNVERMAQELTLSYVDDILAEKFVQAVCEKNRSARMLVRKLAEEAGYRKPAAKKPHLSLVT